MNHHSTSEAHSLTHAARQLARVGGFKTVEADDLSLGEVQIDAIEHQQLTAPRLRKCLAHGTYIDQRHGIHGTQISRKRRSA